ncbi:hypothetical protein BN2475_1310003 [Paraburkholderia ribeironis]|uniref:Uncharacterized protein n=1 Tax=Paraburkholderia ribeironis TaxID=1247936 RepID=A0A1N7SPJ0_9BURK|nr:hypothetical protein BN2475_1310003 [Paraburkholderia ribeironis]
MCSPLHDRALPDWCHSRPRSGQCRTVLPRAHVPYTLIPHTSRDRIIGANRRGVNHYMGRFGMRNVFTESKENR